MAFSRLAALLKRMDQQLAKFDRQHDNRAAFLRVYVHMTRRVMRRMEGSFFLDPAWIEQVALRFADLYFDALHRFDSGKKVPPAWQLAFSCAVERRCYLLQDIVLGVNAHINNDLAQAVAAILQEEDDTASAWRLQRRRFDHDQINRILHEIVPAVEGEAAQHYGRLVGLLGWALGHLDEGLTVFGLKQFRDHTWRNALCLVAAKSDDERTTVRHWMEQDALAVGEMVVKYGAPAWSRPAARFTRRWRLC